MRYCFYLLGLVVILAGGCKKESIEGSSWKGQVVPNGYIPIVFHVLYENSSDKTQFPDPDVFVDYIGQLNRFFSATLFPQAGSTAIGTQFMLATHTPDGSVMAEPGVHRVAYSGASNMGASSFLALSPTGSRSDIFWNPDYYINIWLFGFGGSDESNVAGIAHLPYTPTSNALPGLSTGGEYYFTYPMTKVMHGIVLNNRYFQVVSEGIPTMIHEIGHYLGLLHAFGEDACCDSENHCKCENCDYSDDYCSDTPRYNRLAYQQQLNSMGAGDNPYMRTSCKGVSFRSANIMDYYYSDRSVFTPEQRDRMHHVLQYSPLIPRSSSSAKSRVQESRSGEGLEPPVPRTVSCPGS